MKTSDLLNSDKSSAAGIARSIVAAVIKQNYVPEDVEKAVNQAILKFADNVKEHARQELKFQQIRKI